MWLNFTKAFFSKSNKSRPSTYFKYISDGYNLTAFEVFTILSSIGIMLYLMVSFIVGTLITGANLRLLIVTAILWFVSYLTSYYQKTK